jgi:hypothetical protein
MTQFMWAVLSGAVKHAQRPEVKEEPYTSVTYFLRVLSAQIQAKGFYRLSWEVKTLLRRIEQDKAVNPVYKELRAMFRKIDASNPLSSIPVCNTGITPVQSEMLEDYVDGRTQMGNRGEWAGLPHSNSKNTE